MTCDAKANKVFPNELKYFDLDTHMSYTYKLVLADAQQHVYD